MSTNKNCIIKIKNTFALSLCLYSFLSFGQTSTEIILPDSNIVFKINEIEGVILGLNFKTRVILDSSRTLIKDPLKNITEVKNAKRYLVDLNKVELIEPKLKAFMWENNHFISENLHFYVKQYLGYTISTGDSVIYINCFYFDDIKNNGNWKSSIVRVFDGGPFFFSVKYNCTKNEFFELYINGFG